MIKLSKPQWLNYRYRRGGRRVLNRSTEWGKAYVDGWQEYPIYSRYGRSYSVSREALLDDDLASFADYAYKKAAQGMGVPRQYIMGNVMTVDEIRAMYRKE